MAAKRAKYTRTAQPRGDVFSRVERLTRNLWWTWNTEPQRLFAGLDPVAWEATNHNPLRVLEGLTTERRRWLADNERFVAQLDSCEQAFDAYWNARTWFERAARGRKRNMLVAYFCAEFALHESLPQYSGGLGVLAGDHLKSASDLGIPLVGVGLLYRHGFYRQFFDVHGNTLVYQPRLDFAELPLQDTGRAVHVPMARRAVEARIWRVDVGRVALYLLDTDVSANRPKDRAITRDLYGGDNETRIQQELILGIGGVRALDALGIRPTLYHLNEGHAAFCALERLRQRRADGVDDESAREEVRRATVFTTHTPVPAGHDRFDPGMTMRYLKPLADDLGLDRKPLLALGRENPDDRNEPFCMTILALKLAGRCNGVSELHGVVSREMWQNLYGVDTPDDVPIGHVTNGVHPQTWLAPEIEPLYERHLKPEWVGLDPEEDWWQRARSIPAEDLWRVRCVLRRRLVHFIRRRLREQIERRLGPRAELIAAADMLDENALTIGFARRFATYKRAPLIFRNRRRLAAILNDPQRPVQLVFAGKAHPRDEPGQEFAKQIFDFARRKEFRGKVVLLEDYDMHVGRMLVSGCDVWLNNPLRPREASGTSGMKPPLHGGLNLSILDGWWPEGFNGRNGWAIGTGDEKSSRNAQDRHDANEIYRLLEEEIVPLFYQRDRSGVPNGWARRMVASMASVFPTFSSHRMLADYMEHYYGPAARA